MKILEERRREIVEAHFSTLEAFAAELESPKPRWRLLSHMSVSWDR